MDAAMLRSALEIALEDEAFAAAFEGATSLAVSESDDGAITLDAGDESVVIGAEDLMGDAGESESPSMPPPPPAGA